MAYCSESENLWHIAQNIENPCDYLNHEFSMLAVDATLWHLGARLWHIEILKKNCLVKIKIKKSCGISFKKMKKLPCFLDTCGILQI